MISFNVIRNLSATLWLLILTMDTWGQAENRTGTPSVSMVVVFDKSRETKDGFYVNGYVVNISHARGMELHGKKIRIRGAVTIVKGLSRDNDGPERQGREHDTKHILHPRIRIIR